MAQADGTVNYIPANNKILNMAHSYRVTHFPCEYMLGKTALKLQRLSQF